MKRIVIFALGLLSLQYTVTATHTLLDKDIKQELRPLFQQFQQTLDAVVRQELHNVLTHAYQKHLANPHHKPFAIAFDIDNTLVFDRNLEFFLTGKAYHTLSDFRRPIYPSMLFFYQAIKTKNETYPGLFTFFFVTGRADAHIEKDTGIPFPLPSANTTSIKTETVNLLHNCGYTDVTIENLFCFPFLELDPCWSTDQKVQEVATWKIRDVLAQINQNYDLLAYFDDEAVAIEALKHRLPETRAIQMPKIIIIPQAVSKPE